MLKKIYCAFFFVYDRMTITIFIIYINIIRMYQLYRIYYYLDPLKKKKKNIEMINF